MAPYPASANDEIERRLKFVKGFIELEFGMNNQIDNLIS